MSITKTGPGRLAIASWIVLGAALLAFIFLAANELPALAIAALLLPWATIFFAMFKRARNAFAYAMLASIVYTLLGVMEIMSQPRSFSVATLFAAIALLTFFAVIPATRLTRRADTHE